MGTGLWTVVHKPEKSPRLSDSVVVEKVPIVMRILFARGAREAGDRLTSPCGRIEPGN